MAHVMNVSNLPVECLEMEFPLLVERVQLRMDSGGAGQFRGGLGVRRDYRILTDTARMAMIAERTTVAHWGLAGGLGGGLGGFVVNPETPQQREVNSRLGEVELTRGDVASVQTAGAGGFAQARISAIAWCMAAETAAHAGSLSSALSVLLKGSQRTGPS